jgi:hypothetical protein
MASIDISKALQVNVEFDLSRQLWSFLVRKGAIKDPQSFVHPVPHMSFVTGTANVSFLRKRFEAMTSHHCYYGMEYAEDRKQIADWVPLVMEGRANDEPVAATRIITGTDVDYGSLTNHLVDYLSASPNFSVRYQQRVTGLSGEDDGRSPMRTASGSVINVSAMIVLLVARIGYVPCRRQTPRSGRDTEEFVGAKRHRGLRLKDHIRAPPWLIVCQPPAVSTADRILGKQNVARTYDKVLAFASLEIQRSAQRDDQLFDGSGMPSERTA